MKDALAFGGLSLNAQDCAGANRAGAVIAVFLVEAEHVEGELLLARRRGDDELASRMHPGGIAWDSGVSLWGCRCYCCHGDEKKDGFCDECSAKCRRIEFHGVKIVSLFVVWTSQGSGACSILHEADVDGCMIFDSVTA